MNDEEKEIEFQKKQDKLKNASDWCFSTAKLIVTNFLPQQLYRLFVLGMYVLVLSNYGWENTVILIGVSIVILLGDICGRIK